MSIAHFPKTILFTLLVVVIALSLSVVFAPITNEPRNYTEGISGIVTFHGFSGPAELGVEIADTPEEHTQGLMNRESLADGEGMLFVFDSDSQRSFWMKNTLIPLDMIFVNSSLDIVSISEDSQPCVSDPCPLYRSAMPAMYVVEANSGFAREHSLEPGQNIQISLF